MTTITGKLSCERFDTSRNGNPRYLCNIDGTFFYTGVDSMNGYSITNYEGKIITVGLQHKRNKLTLISISSEGALKSWTEKA
jgi:hypothetical protein